MTAPNAEPRHERSEFPCSSCGAGLVFAPGTTAMRCPYCDSEQVIEVRDAPIVEYDFDQALVSMPTRPASEVGEGVQVRCKGCGAIQSVVDQSTHCAFCDSPVVIEDSDPQVIVPESVLPFHVPGAEAKSLYEAWLKKRWFAPNDLVRRAKGDGMDGVYLPYWTYDAFATTLYTGQRGEHYYVTEWYTDSDGNRRSRQVRKTRWYPASGTVQNTFDDVLICASESLPAELVRKLEPWDLPALVPYEGRYLSGFRTERYGVDLPTGFQRATGRMEPVIRSTIHSDIGGDEQRIHTMSPRYDDKRFKHLLLPLWISSFRYKETVYRVLVNARSGEVQGERPWSWIKIMLAVVGAIAVIGAIVFLINRQNTVQYDEGQEVWDSRTQTIRTVGGY